MSMTVIDVGGQRTQRIKWFVYSTLGKQYGHCTGLNVYSSTTGKFISS